MATCGVRWPQPKRPLQFCDNAGHETCNWLVEADGVATLCAACRHNQTIPDLSVPTNHLRWQRLEAAKHRLFYSLLRLRLPLRNRIDDPEHGLAFEFLADSPEPGRPKVLTGHDNGLITIALVEADDAERERRRTADGRALPVAGGSLPPRGRPLFLGRAGARRRPAGRMPRGVRRRQAGL